MSGHDRMTFSRIACLIAVLLASPYAANAQGVNVFRDRTKTVSEARTARAQGDYARSITILEGVLEENPKDFDAQYNLGLSYGAADKKVEAIKLLESAVKPYATKSSPDPAIYNSLGWMYFTQGNYDAALKEFKIAELPENFAKLSPQVKRKLIVNIAASHTLLGDVASATEYFKKADGLAENGVPKVTSPKVLAPSKSGPSR